MCSMGCAKDVKAFDSDCWESNKNPISSLIVMLHRVVIIVVFISVLCLCNVLHNQAKVRADDKGLITSLCFSKVPLGAKY